MALDRVEQFIKTHKISIMNANKQFCLGVHADDAGVGPWVARIKL